MVAKSANGYPTDRVGATAVLRSLFWASFLDTLPNHLVTANFAFAQFCLASGASLMTCTASLLILYLHRHEA